MSGSTPRSTTAIPQPDPPFGGTIGHTYKDSTPAYPQPVRAPAGAPNVLLVLLDDIGFGQASVSGGPAATPHLEALAATGVSYNQFHTTSLCSPTRAALLTGRNHHRVGFGTITEGATGYPGFNCALPRSAASIGSIMTAGGHSTAWFGKNHNTPDWESSAVGPYGRASTADARPHGPSGRGRRATVGILEKEAIGMGKHSRTGGGQHSGGKRTGMTPAAAARVQSAGAKNPGSSTAQSGFTSRAQSAAAKGSRTGQS